MGDTVRIKGLTTIGKVENINGDTATAVFGGMRTKMRLNRLEHATATAENVDKTEERKENLASYGISKETRKTIDAHKTNFHQDLDVRGMRGDEALNAVQYFIDDAILVGMPRVRILHGKGNGILRQLIRQYLSSVPNVTHYADEHVQFGGAGITVVDFRRKKRQKKELSSSKHNLKRSYHLLNIIRCNRKKGAIICLLFLNKR